MSKKILIWSDLDLDGAGTQCVLRWLHPKDDITTQGSTISTLQHDFNEYIKSVDLDSFDIVYITDLDTTSISDVIDRDNVIVIDHHKSHLDIIHVYRNLTLYVKEYTSATKLIYKTFEAELNKVITPAQRALIALIDDYDCFELKHPESALLNIVYWDIPGKRINKFVELYTDGFKGFTPENNKSIQKHADVLNNITSRLNPYVGRLGDYSIMCDFVTTSHNDVAAFMLSKYPIDIVALVNPGRETVSFRKAKNSDADLSEIVSQHFEGGGHASAAGCRLNTQFLEFSKTLKPIKI